MDVNPVKIVVTRIVRNRQTKELEKVRDEVYHKDVSCVYQNEKKDVFINLFNGVSLRVDHTLDEMQGLLELREVRER